VYPHVFNDEIFSTTKIQYIGRAGKGMASIDTCCAVAAYNSVSERRNLAHCF
jgi:hypothetical protein